MAWEYTDKVKEFYRKPVNVGEIENPDAIGEVGSIVCGDALRLTLQVDKESEKIVDAKFQTFGCGSAIASSSVLTEMIKGKTLTEASKITNKEIAEELGGLPPEKMHCSVMGQEALEAAIANYRGESVPNGSPEEGHVVCHCFGVTDEKIVKAIRENGLTSVEQVTNYTKAGGGCGSCLDEIEAIVFKVLGQQREEQAAKQEQTPRRLTNLQKIKLIEETIEQEIRPELQKDGGDLQLMDVDGNQVMVSFKGQCRGCMAAGLTLSGVQDRLRKKVTPDLVVVEERAP